MKRFLKNHLYEIGSFLIPFLACFIMCAAMGVWPFGDKCMLHMDMYHQYCPFFTEFAEKLKSGGSLFYTWKLGLGSDYVSLYAYYLASPFNWILLILPESWMIETMEIMELIKIALCGLTMFHFLKYRSGLVTAGEERDNSLARAALVFSTAYALCGFMAAYSWDIMWLDSVALAPLILMGLEKLVKEGKPTLYAVSLALSIWANYYISIMICIFVVFYFGWLFFTNNCKGKAVLRFVLYSLLAGGISAVLLLPEMAVLAYSGSSVGSGFPETFECYFNVFTEFGRMCSCTDTYTGASAHIPNLYTGSFCILLMFLYGFNREIELKKKIPAYLMTFFFMISFDINYLDFIWHGFHFPQSLPGRQSFLFSALLILMGYECWRKREALKLWQIIASVGLAAVCLTMSAVFADSELTPLWSYAITGLFLVLYLLVYVMRKYTDRFQILFFVAMGELILNMAVTGFYTTSRSDYIDQNADYKALEEVVAEAEGDNFYRIEDLERNTKNDSSLRGYSSATIFSSLMNLDVSHFYQSVYMEGGKNYYCYNGATPITSAMLAVDYVICEDELPESDYRTLVAASGSLKLYKNTYTLPVGYVMPQSVIDNWDNTYEVSADRIDNLNELASLLGAEEDYLTQVTMVDETEEVGTATITIPADGYYYAGYVNNSGDNITIRSSAGYTRKFSKASHRYLFDLGECSAGDTITIETSAAETVSYRLYQLNEEAVDQAYQTLSRETFEVSSYSDTRIEGSITTDGGELVFSVPKVPGWTVYVDGEETEATSFCDAFLAVDLESGRHEISLVYHTPYLKVGAVISAFSLALLLILLILRRKQPWKRKESAS